MSTPRAELCSSHGRAPFRRRCLVLAGALAPLLAGALVGPFLSAHALGAPPDTRIAGHSTSSGLAISSVSVNGETHYLGLAGGPPVFDWGLSSDQQGAEQSAYRIVVGTSPDPRPSTDGLAWDSGKQMSSQQSGVRYEGPDLEPRTRYHYAVRVWSAAGTLSRWREGWYETALPPEDWKGTWIGRDVPDDAADAPVDGRASRLRTTFDLPRKVRSARLYATALGVYAAELNGKPVTSDRLAPGWTDYNHRIQHQTYDVTRLLRQGKNALGFELATGWYAGSVADQKNMYGSTPAVRAQLEVVLRNGQRRTFSTNEDWTTIRGPVRQGDLQDGEIFDARKDRRSWSSPMFRADRWKPVSVVTEVPAGAENIVPQADPPVRVTRLLAARSVSRLPNGDHLVDFGQNFAGVARLTVRDQPRGQEITMRFAEQLNPDGTPHFANLRQADQTDKYIAAGRPTETWAPTFTQHGFRYVLVSGLKGALGEDDLVGQVWRTTTPETGRLKTSSPLLNRIISNTMWSQRSNFISVPTDCPQRSERLGWTGDINMFAPTAALNMDIRRFLGDKWMRDLEDAQDAAGRISVVVPQQGLWSTRTSGEDVVWAGASVTVPYVAWQTYGDTSFIDENWELMAKFVNSFAPTAPTTIFGDWAPPPPSPQDDNNPVANVRDNPAVALAWYKHVLDMMADMAAATGREQEATEYELRSTAAKNEFQAAYTLPTGQVSIAGQEDQTLYALALDFDLLPESSVAPAGERLVELVKSAGDGWDITTGFAGFPRILDALTKAGQLEAAYRVLAQEDYPSLGYGISKGATSIWEYWAAVRPDGTVTDSSLNHYAYGSVVDWVYRVAAGLRIDPSAPGFQNTVFQPQPGGGLTNAAASVKTVRGLVSSKWTMNEGRLRYTVVVPPSSTGEVHLPAPSASQVHLDTSYDQVTLVQDRSGDVVYRVPAGTYTFSHPLEGPTGLEPVANGAN